MHSVDPSFRLGQTHRVPIRSIVAHFALALAAWIWIDPSLALGILDAEVVGPDGHPVEDAVVFLQPLSGQKAAERAPASASISQHDREFAPYLTIVQTGAAVRFPNKDPIRHHVYSFSNPKKFEIKLYAGDGPEPIVFDKPGIVTIGCNVHDWMLAYLFVVDTPWFGKTDSQGRLQIDTIQDGAYEAHVWHPRQRHETPPHRLEAASGTLRFVLEIAPRRPRYKPPADSLSYRP